jgi:hypothetical protein
MKTQNSLVLNARRVSVRRVSYTAGFSPVERVVVVRPATVCPPRVWSVMCCDLLGGARALPAVVTHESAVAPADVPAAWVVDGACPTTKP